MYRSFMTCDDPKGVVECGTIRKSRSGSQKMKDKTKDRRTAENLETSLPDKSDKEMVPKGSTEKSCDPSSLQLMEVSRGAQRLNYMIGSWSRGLRYDGRSEDIARDLLKGALDLQESLVMLRTLQEASQHMARLKRKRNENPERVRIDAKMIDRTYTNQFSEQSYPMGFERPRLSADGSSRNCTEELKKVIKDSLVRQNLYPITTTEGLDSASEIPSTSSSQSSGVHTDRLSDSSFSSTASKKERGPNLVAKLMGLEEVPSRPMPAAGQKQLQCERILNQKRPIFEIDVPKVEKTNSITEKVDPERKKTLREILETMHFKGLLKKSSVKEPKHRIHHFNDHHSKQFVDLPPIVLMKPRCCSYQQSVKTHEPVRPQELSMRKLKAEAVPSKSIKHKEGSTSIGKRTEDVTKRLTQEEKAKLLKESMKLDVKEIIPNEKVPHKVKLYNHVSHKPEKSEAIDKKAKVKTINRKSPEEQISKPRIVARSQDQREITPTKFRTPQSGSRIKKDEIPCQQSTTSITISKTKVQKINHSKDQSKNQKKKQRHVAVAEAAKPVAEQVGPGEGEKSIAVPFKDDCTDIRTIATPAVELPMGHEVDASANKIGEDCKESQSSSGDVMLLKSEHESDATSAEEAHDRNNCVEIDSKVLKYLLLTSQSFIGHAEELLNLDVDCPITVQKYETNGIARLYLDCANELTERKSLQDSQIVHPFLLTCAGNSGVQISLGRLVEEICNAIENLKFYTIITGEKLSVDNLYAMMRRDIKCNGLINGIWDWGWRHGFSADEAEQVVNEVESLVLNGLIEELIINL